MSTHQNYNLVFLNELWRNGKSYKTCELINNTPSYVILSTYLIYVQYPDAILEYTLPDVELALSGQPFEDISVETINVELVSSQPSLNGLVGGKKYLH